MPKTPKKKPQKITLKNLMPKTPKKKSAAKLFLKSYAQNSEVRSPHPNPKFKIQNSKFILCGQVAVAVTKASTIDAGVVVLVPLSRPAVHS